MIGQQFGTLTVVERRGSRPNGHHPVAAWLCRCECGSERIVATTELKRGRTTACKKSEPIRSSEYRTYHTMKGRCLRQSNQDYASYGGRGIKICKRWLLGVGCKSGFQYFLLDMGKRPSPQHSIDRINNNGNYEPSNCRWATIEQQISNRRNTRRVVFRGETMPLAVAARLAGIDYDTVSERLNRYGMTVERALSKPVRASRER